MRQEADGFSQRDASLMDALIRHSLQDNQAAGEARVQRLLACIRAQGLDVASNQHVGHATKQKIWSRRRWLPVSLGAAVVATLVFMLQTGGRQNAALAAVERSIIAETRNDAREYQVTLVARGAKGLQRTSTHQLFVRQRDFAICTTPRLGSGEIWIGGQDGEHWIVPRFGTVLVGDEELFKRPMLNNLDLETPFMSVAAILERIRYGYDLVLHPDVELKVGSKQTNCEHIVAIRKSRARPSIPERVEFWADRDSGFALRIELSWGPESQESRWLTASAQLIGTPALPDNFFDHRGHHASDRPVERMSN